MGHDGVLGRQGGEEFCVLMPGHDLAQALALAERIRAAVASHAFFLPARHGVEETAVQRLISHRQTISLGVATWREGLLDGDDLLDAADRRLYQAKHAGRDQVCG